METSTASSAAAPAAHAATTATSPTSTALPTPAGAARSSDRSVALLAGSVLTPDPFPGAIGVLVQGRQIRRVLTDPAQVPVEAAVHALGPHAVLMPGLIDMHTHGGWGLRYTDGPEAARTILRRRAESGCTGVLMTVGGPPSEMVSWLPPLAEVVGQATGGAVSLGFHVEGPWLNWDAWVSWGARPGSGRQLVPPEIEDFHRIQAAASGHIHQVSCAPEFPEALSFIEALADAGIIVSIGHTNASPELAREAIAAGVRHSTHTFNGMQPLHHRTPGVAGVVLTDPRVVAELIPDGAHVHPIIQHLLYRAKGADSISLVTDASGFSGFPPGTYYDGQRQLEIRDDLGCWSSAGNLAGSSSPIDRDIAVLTSEGGVPLEHAARMGSTVPATELGLAHRKGKLLPGYDADIAAFAPQPGARLGAALRDLPGADRRCQLTMVAGEIVYQRGVGDAARAEEDAALAARFRSPA